VTVTAISKTKGILPFSSFLSRSRSLPFYAHTVFLFALFIDMMAKSGLTAYQQRQLSQAASSPFFNQSPSSPLLSCSRLAVTSLPLISPSLSMTAGGALPTDVGPTSKRTEPKVQPSRSKAHPTIQVSTYNEALTALLACLHVMYTGACLYATCTGRTHHTTRFPLLTCRYEARAALYEPETALGHPADQRV
jgi:hypothetical protein